MKPIKIFFLTLSIIFVVSVLIEIPFRVYDYVFRYRDLRSIFAGEKRELPFYEIQTYFFKKGYCVWDSNLFWCYKKGVINNYEFNSLGLRTINGKEPERFKNGKIYRIIVMGGSHPFGLGVNYGQTYAQQLEEFFRKEQHKCAKSVEVINAAVPGYSTLQALNLLKYHMVNYSPDLVIIDAGTNDGILLTPDWPWKDSEVIKRMNPLLCQIVNVLERSSFFWYYKIFLRKIMNSVNNKKHIDFTKCPTRVSREENYQNLCAIKKLAYDNNFKVIFLSQVVMLGGKLEKGFGAIVEPYLDIYSKLKDNPNICEYFIDINHASVKGHKEIAKIIYDYLISNSRICEELK